MPLALSTAWNSLKHDNAKELLQEIKNSGFSDVELSFNLTASMIEEISSLVKAGEVNIVSLHNFCPVPEGIEREKALPDYYSMASLKEEERNLCLKYARRTIDVAKGLKAKAVVLHAGRVEVPDLTLDLIRLFNAGKQDSEEYSGLLSEMQELRRNSAGPYFDTALRSLEILDNYAKDKGIALGIENRFYHCEVPSFEEIGRLIDYFKDSNIFYWHDTGHAQVGENLGFRKHNDYLKLYAGRMAGIHLHDIQGTRDHQVPGRGEIDFKNISRYIKNVALKVIEVHYPATGKQILESKNYLEGLFDARA